MNPTQNQGPSTFLPMPTELPGDAGCGMAEATSTSRFPRNMELQSANPGYTPFADAMDELLALAAKTGDALSWVPATPAEDNNGPTILFRHAEGKAGMGLSIVPVDNDGKLILGDPKSSPFQAAFAPLIIRNVETLGSSSFLRENQLQGHLAPISGAAEEAFDRPHSFADHLRGLSRIERYTNSVDFTDQTIVVRLVALLPRSASGDYQCEFTLPCKSQGFGSSLAFVSTGNKIGERAWVLSGQQHNIQRPEKDSVVTRFRALPFDDLDSFSRLLAPGELSGHVTVALAPVKIDTDPFASFGFSKRNVLGDFGGDGMKSMGIGRTDIVGGARTGISRVSTDPMSIDRSRTPIIFNIQVLAVTPEAIAGLSPADLEKLVREQYSAS